MALDSSRGRRKQCICRAHRTISSCCEFFESARQLKSTGDNLLIFVGEKQCFLGTIIIFIFHPWYDAKYLVFTKIAELE